VEYEKHRAAIEAAGARLVALSVDEAVRSESLRKRYKLGFTILCDTKREVVDGWNLYNREENGGIAHTATFVIDKERRVRLAVRESVVRRAALPELVTFLEGNRSEAPSTHVVLPSLSSIAGAVRNSLRFGVRQPKE